MGADVDSGHLLNPLFFLGLWLGATLMMYAIGKDGYPGVRLHLTLMAISVPLWWWLELVNLRTGDWIYILTQDYSPFWYALLSSLAYSTVVPALHAAWRLTIGHAGLSPIGPGSARGRGCITEIVAGASALVALFVFPGIFFPFVWVAPFLILDEVMGYGGGRRLVADLVRGEWRLPAAISLAGLMCGILWEFWNFWSTPKRVYDVPFFDFLYLFEMPFVGYAGYVPFTWSVYQLLQLSSLRPVLATPPKPESTEGRLEESGRGVRELQGK